MEPLLLIAAAMGVMALSGKKKRGGGVTGGDRSKSSKSGIVQKVSPQATLINPAASMEAIKLSRSEWPEMTFDIPFAAGVASSVWPTVTNHPKKFVISYRSVSGIMGNGSRRFMASRSSGDRYHVGIDLYGYPGDPILAMENGTIVNTYYFYNKTYALIVQCDSGLVINYGEVKRNSWKEFGLSKGSRVKKGRAIARVGMMSGGSYMLHLETYMPPTKVNNKYWGGESTGPILNPTYYLLRARFLAPSEGRRFSGLNCKAAGSLNRVIPENLKAIEIEDMRVGEAPGDSVLPELLVEDQWRPEKNVADGP